MKYLAFFLAIYATACTSEDASHYDTTADTVWTLVALDGTPFPAKATLTFPTSGQLAGRAPCNAYRAEQTASYPAFAAGPILSTKAACPDLRHEQRYLKALGEMTHADITKTTLVLTSTNGRTLQFKPDV